MNAVSPIAGPAPEPIADFEGRRELIEAWLRGMELDPELMAWQWANENIVLTPEMAAEPGPYSLDRTPYLIEILENLSPVSKVMKTYLMKGSQIGASQAGLAYVLFVVAVAGGPCLVICPTVKTAELYSKQRLEPLIRACAAAAEKIPPNKGKQSGNTILLKTFPGGVLRLIGAQSANALKSMPVKILILEEPDEYEKDLKDQGDTVKMALRRITSYGRRAKVFANCTPGLLSNSTILPLFNEGDQREYRMPCPHGCGHLTTFNRELFRFEKGKPHTAHMVCENVECGKPIEEGRHKTKMMALGSGRWVPKVVDAPRDTPRSYYLPAFYSPIGWESWADIARDTEAAEGNYELTKALWNQTYGLPWNDATDRPNFETLHARRASYLQRQVPAGVTFVAAGLDVGEDHVEIHVWGFGRKMRRWLIEKVRLRGLKTDPDLWRRVRLFLQRCYWHPCGAVLPIRRAGIDRGHAPDIVMPWVQQQNPDRVVAVRGAKDLEAPVLSNAKWRFRADDGGWQSEEGLRYWVVGVGLLKLELYSQLAIARGDPDAEAPPGWVEFPYDVDADWCEQLVSEEYVLVKAKYGRARHAWKSIGGLRHEALDCANYARAMADTFGWSTWSSAEFDDEERGLLKAADDLRRAMANLERERIAAGDHRPVTPEDIVPTLVRPTTPHPDEKPEAAPAAPAGKPEAPDNFFGVPEAGTVPAAPDDGWGDDAGSGWGGGWGADVAPGVASGNAGCSFTADTIPHAPVRGAWDTDDDLL